jgi:2-deoxystreptamine N-acetyl-D-glucosaminyltransferase/2-deoxystreptamine glucosyltransferase
MTAASPDLARRSPSRPRPAVRGTVLRLCSVFEPAPAALARPDAAAYDPVGGMQNHTAELTRSLDRLGVAQSVLTSRLGGPRGSSLRGGATVTRTGLPVRGARQLWALEAAARGLTARDVGLVHAHQGEDLAVLPLAELVARRAGVPLVVTLHCSVARTLDRTARRPLSVLGPAVERRALARADAVLVLTDSAARALRDDGVDPARVHVLPSGYAPALFARPTADPLPGVPRPRVLFAGRLAAQKRPLDVVAAHALLPDDVHLVVVGDGALRGELERAVAASPARDRVHVVGMVPHEQVPAFLRSADAFVLPSHYEELGSALVEAMAAGLPVVANRVGGIPDLVVDGETGLLADRGDVEGLAAALKRVLGDADLAAGLAARSRAHVEAHYGWPALAERVIEVYADVQRG